MVTKKWTFPIVSPKLLFLPLSADLSYCFNKQATAAANYNQQSLCSPLLTRSWQHSFGECFFLNRKTFLQQKSVNIFLSSTGGQYLSWYWDHSEEIRCDRAELLAVTRTFWHFHRVFKYISREESVFLVQAHF